MAASGQYRCMEPTLRAHVRAGDPDAFGALFDGCARKVYNHAFRMTGSWSAAEEVVSLTFLEAWRLRARVHPVGGSLDPWVLGICVNVTRNIVRAERRHQAAMRRLPPSAAYPDFAEDVASRVDNTARMAAVTQVIGRLSQQEREVIGLCVWSGLDYRAAAEALNLPIGTVRSRLSRARKKLERLARGAPPLSSGEREPSAFPGQAQATPPGAVLRAEGDI
jgi:RNA polymerase sigma factor (sigma-70 family)